MRAADICSVQEVVVGDRDLKVPRLLVLVQQAHLSAFGLWVLRLKDPTGAMIGYLSLNAAKMHASIISRGSVILLSNVRPSYLKHFINIESLIDIVLYLNTSDNTDIHICK